MNRRGFASKFHAPKHFTEMIKLGDIVSPGAGSPANWYNFPITGQMIGNLNASLYEVFKQFCVTGVKLTYLPQYNSYTNITGSTFNIPRIYYAEDKSSFTAVNVAQMLQQDNLKIFDSSKKWTHYIRNPRPWLAESEGNSGSTYVPATTPARQITWLPTDNEAGAGTTGMVVQHLHSAIVVDPNNGSAVPVGTLWARVYYACKEQQ